jgi:uncharacterized membrane protein YphA (DoxX/SURF4 family)
MPEELWPWMHLIGRILFALVFIGSGFGHLMQLDNTATYAKSKGVPAPKAAAAVTGLMIIAGGLSIALGWHRFIGAGLLVVFLLPAAFMMHAFWNVQDPMARQNEMAHFMKDIALAGAALFIAFYAGHPWPLSLGG